MPTRFEPDGDPIGFCLVLPGRAYSPAMPLLDYGKNVFLEQGFAVQQVWWDAPGNLTDDDEHNAAWLEGEVRTALAAEGALPDRVVVLAKSLGCYSAPLVAELGLDAVFLTPVLIEERVASGIAACTGRTLLVGGTGDYMWDAGVAADLGRRPGCDVLEIEGADHSMLVPGGPSRTSQSIPVLGRIVGAIEDFLVER